MARVSNTENLAPVLAAFTKWKDSCLVEDGSLFSQGPLWTPGNIEEVRARKGPVIIIATEGDEEMGGKSDDIIYIPKAQECLEPLLTVLPLQLLAYHIALLRGCDVDKPRNLAKSVTVE